jgi:hypothetical protein
MAFVVAQSLPWSPTITMTTGGANYVRKCTRIGGKDGANRDGDVGVSDLNKWRNCTGRRPHPPLAKRTRGEGGEHNSGGDAVVVVRRTSGQRE